MSDIKGLLLRGSVLRAAMLFANVAVALYMMPFLVHAIGDRWYGMWTLVATFMGYYGYLDFGLSVSVQRFIAGAIGRKDEDEANRLITTSFLLFAVLGVVILIVTLVVAFFAPWFFTDPTEIHTFQIVLAILGVNAALTFAMAPVNGLMSGHLRFDIMTYINLGKLAVRTALIVYFITAGYSIISLALITLLADTGGNVLKVLIVRKMFAHIRIRRRYYTRERIAELFSYGGKTFVNQIADLLRFQIDHLVIAAAINLSAVTVFNIASQLVYYFRSLMTALMGVLVSVFARYQAENDRAAISKAYFFTSKISAVAALMIGGGMIIFGSPFISLWMGPEYSGAYTVMVILTIPTVLYIALQPALALMFGLGAVGPLAKVSILEALANLGLSLLLVWSYGLVGVALGTAIPLTFFSTFLLVYSCRLLETPVRTFFRHVGPVFVTGFLLQLAGWYVVQQVSITGYVDMLLLSLLLFPAQALLMFFLTFTIQERRLMVEAGRRALGMRATSTE